MASKIIRAAGVGAVLLLGLGFVALRAVSKAQDAPQDPAAAQAGLPVSDPSCTYFTPEYREAARADLALQAGILTNNVAGRLPRIAIPRTGARRSRAAAVNLSGAFTDTIDKYIFPALSAAGVEPAPPTTDFEFIRRVTLDLTGRIPAPAAVLSFVNDTSPDKRAKLVDSLIGSPAFLDKWTVWFADLYQNNSKNTQIRRFVPGVIAFNDYIRSSLAANKAYDQMAREIIAAQGSDSYTQGELNYLVGGVVTGGPIQDIFDQQAANVATTFLGLSNLNCLLCHNGRGHLDQINLWGYYTTRQQAWGMASFMSHTYPSRTPVTSGVKNSPYYWGLADNTRYKKDYQLNTQSGNRPPRGDLNSTATVAPSYIFTGEAPKSGENYRAALGRMITSDPLFAEATANYLWEYFFTVGIVSPSNQFDPYRLDPDHPPSNCPLADNPCTLQPSNAGILKALAQDFVTSGYDLRALMREIVNSQTYQLSSRYEGNWDPSKANLFGRKLVRRLWSEEVHDAIVDTSGITPSYKNANWGPVSYAMQLPEPLNTPDGANGPMTAFLDSFLRGNRDDQPRRPDGSISQALSLMNDNFVMSRLKTTTGILKTVLAMPDDQLVNTLFLTVLSRYATSDEMSGALANLKANRTQGAQMLLWSLYNKVDFVFNY